MIVEEFIKRRKEERNWIIANGFSNDDPETNGEYMICEAFKNQYKIFVDIGANIGEYSEKVKKINSDDVKIYSFEPNPKLQNKIKEKIGDGNVVVSKALSNCTGTLDMNIHVADTTVSSAFERTEMMPSFSKNMEKVVVPVDTLNNYSEDIMKSSRNEGIFIKIDVEGAEMFVLEGADEVFSNDIPMIIMFEHAFGWKETKRSLKEAFHYLDKFGFSMFRVLPIGLEKIRFYTIEMNDYVYCNYVAIKNVDVQRVFKERRKISNSIGETELYIYEK